MNLRPSIETAIDMNRMRQESDEVALLPIALLDGPSPDEMMFSMNLRQDWRGFSFGNFWFGYYFGGIHSSPQTEERCTVA